MTSYPVFGCKTSSAAFNDTEITVDRLQSIAFEDRFTAII